MTAPLPRFNDRVESTPLPEAAALVAPIAEFSSAGAGGHSVQFTDLSSDPAGGQIVEWDWDFGDTGGAPTANFTFQVTGLVVQFTDTSTAITPKTITNWLWNFGDGGTSTSQNPSHTYTAAGSYAVKLTVTDSGAVVSPIKQRTVTLNQAGGLGRPFGASQIWESTSSLLPNSSLFNASLDGVTNNTILGRIAAARSRGHHLVLNMTGGAHTQYITAGKFDFGKWKARMDTYNTSAIRTAMADAVADRTVIGNSMMDESQHPDWGGVVTKSLLDQMWQYAHDIFPTLPIGVVELGNEDGYAGTFQKVDFTVHSYLWRRPTSDYGNVNLWRQLILSMNAAQGVQTLFMINPLNGGRRTPEDPDAAGCPLPLTGGQGTFNVNCRMTVSQVRTFGVALAPYGAGIILWRWDSAMWASSAYQGAFADIRAALDAQPVVSLKAIR